VCRQRESGHRARKGPLHCFGPRPSHAGRVRRSSHYGQRHPSKRCLAAERRASLALDLGTQRPVSQAWPCRRYASSAGQTPRPRPRRPGPGPNVSRAIAFGDRHGLNHQGARCSRNGSDHPAHSAAGTASNQGAALHADGPARAMTETRYVKGQATRGFQAADLAGVGRIGRA